MFKSETDLVQAIDRHDEMVRRCARGEIGFTEFCDQYQDFYAYYALDGHESDDEEKVLLDKYERRIEPHRIIAYEILGKVCSDSDALLESYKSAGRFGSIEAVRLLKGVVFST